MNINQKIGWMIMGCLCPLTMSTVSAEAATFKYFYTFESEETISGQVDGDLVEVEPGVNRLNNISNFSAEYSGQGGISYSFPIPSVDIFSLSGNTRLVFGGADIPSSESGIGMTGNGFIFFVGTDPATPFLGGVFVGEYTPSVNGFGFRTTLEGEIFAVERWQASQVTSVPEPISIISLSIFGLIGYGLKKVRA